MAIASQEPKTGSIPADRFAHLHDQSINFADYQMALDQLSYRAECLALLLSDLNQEVFQYEEHLSDRISCVVHSLEDLGHALTDPLEWLPKDEKVRLQSIR